MVKESFAKNLAKKKNTEASNVRGNAKKFGAVMAIDNNKDTYWATDDTVKNASLTIDLGKPTLFNRLLIQEYIRLGQRVKAFTLEVFVDGAWKEIAKATTIGYKRILRFPSVNASKVRINIIDSKACPVISNIGIYDAPSILDAPVILRSNTGDILISSNDIGPYLYYTLDGSEPTPKSALYSGPIKSKGKIEVKAIACDPASGKSSPVSQEKFDISRNDWKIVGISDENTKFLIDGNPNTVYHQRDKKMPIDLVIDLGKTYNLRGFKYLPDQNRWSAGIVTNYQIYISENNGISETNIDWKLVSEGEFSNIKNNPVWQIKSFTPINARYIKLRALSNAYGDDVAGYAEIDVITN